MIIEKSDLILALSMIFGVFVMIVSVIYKYWFVITKFISEQFVIFQAWIILRGNFGIFIGIMISFVSFVIFMIIIINAEWGV